MKTVLQNFIDSLTITKSQLAKDLEINQSIISNDLKSANSLKMTFKYAKKLGMEELEFKGIEHGMYIEGKAKIKI